MINPLPQRTARHTNHDKEYACLLKGKKKKKCTILFFGCFKKFDQVARKCLGMAMYSLRQGRRAVRMAAVPSVSSDPRHCSSKPLPLRLQSRGDVPSSIPPRASWPCACEPGTGLPPRTAGHRVGSRATWPWQAGSELR